MQIDITVLDLLVDALVVFLKLAIPALPGFQPKLRYLYWKRSKLTAKISAERSRPNPRRERLAALQTQFAMTSESLLQASRAREKTLRKHSEIYRYVTGILCYLIVGRLLSRLHFLLYLKPFRGGINYLTIVPAAWVKYPELTKALAFDARNPTPGSVGYFVVELALSIPMRLLVRLLLPPYDSLAGRPSLRRVLENLYLGKA